MCTIPDTKSLLFVGGDYEISENSISGLNLETACIFQALEKGKINFQVQERGKHIVSYSNFDTIIYNGNNGKLLQLIINFCNKGAINLLNISKEKDIFEKITFPKIQNFIYLDAPCINIKHMLEIKNSSNKKNWFEDVNKHTIYTDNLDYSDIIEILEELNMLNNGKHHIKNLIDDNLL